MAEPTIEDRIASLTAQRDESATRSDAVIEENHKLQDRLRKLETQLAAISALRPEGPSDDEVKSVLTGTGDSTRRAQSSRVSAADVSTIVADTVREALKPIVQRFAADDAAAALRAAHTESFARAAQEVPEVLNKDSEVHKVAAKVLAGRPDLAGIADGPRIAAYIAKGIVADNARATKAETSRKTAASIPARPHTPQPDLQDDMTERLEIVAKTREDVLKSGALTAGEGATAAANLFRAKLTEMVAANQE